MKNTRRGAAAIEMAMLMPLFILLVFGIIEFSRVLMVNNILTNAAREGARFAVTPTARNAPTTTKVNAYLAAGGITGATTSILIDGVAGNLDDLTTNVGDLVTVTVSVPYSQVTIGFAHLVSSSVVFSSSIEMRKEGRAVEPLP